MQDKYPGTELPNDIATDYCLLFTVSYILTYNMKKIRELINPLFPKLESFKTLIDPLFQVDSVWSVIARFVIWGVIALTIIVSVDSAKFEDGTRNLKSNLGLLLLFLVLGSVLVYFLFSFSTST